MTTQGKRLVSLEDTIQPAEWLCEICGEPFKVGDTAYDDGDLTKSIWLCATCAGYRLL